MSYGKVHEEFWDGEKIIPLSDRACLLAAYLITGPHRNAIGCFKLGIGAITDIERFKAWGIDGVSKALLEMVKTGFIVRDDRTGWTFITNALVKDPIKGPKAAIHAAKLAAAVPANSIVYSTLKEKLEGQLRKEEKALSDSEGWPMRSPIEGPSIPHTIPKASPSPLPEPSPEPQPEPSEAKASGAPAAAPNVSHETSPANDGPIPLWMIRIDNGDYRKAFWNQGLAFVAENTGKKPEACRTILGNWCKLAGDDHRALWDALIKFEKLGKGEVVSWMQRHLTPREREPELGAGDGLKDYLWEKTLNG